MSIAGHQTTKLGLTTRKLGVTPQRNVLALEVALGVSLSLEDIARIQPGNFILSTN